MRKTCLFSITLLLCSQVFANTIQTTKTNKQTQVAPKTAQTTSNSTETKKQDDTKKGTEASKNNDPFASDTFALPESI